MIKPTNKVALVAGNRLGDGLIMQLITYNLYLAGYDVTLFNTPLLTLKEWFPWTKIEPHFPQGESPDYLSEFQTLVFQHHNRHARDPISSSQEKFVLYGSPLYMNKRSLVDIYLETCSKIFGIEQTIRSNGIQIPKHLSYRKYSNRIVMHPLSLRPEKNWPLSKFIELGHQLRVMGYDPKYTVSPNEEEQIQTIKDAGFDIVLFPKLSELAAYIYESGFMIGNDSGIAHLASSIRIPATALFIRPSVAKRWKPNFSKSYPVLPWLHLPGPKLKEKYWKQLISVKDVLRTFKRVIKAHPVSGQQHISS